MGELYIGYSLLTQFPSPGRSWLFFDIVIAPRGFQNLFNQFDGYSVI
jgi:hypothetical protein